MKKLIIFLARCIGYNILFQVDDYDNDFHVLSFSNKAGAFKLLMEKINEDSELANTF